MDDDDIDEILDAVEKRVNRLDLERREYRSDVTGKANNANSCSKESKVLDLIDILDEFSDEEDELRHRKYVKGQNNTTTPDAKSAKIPFKKGPSHLPSTTNTTKCFQVLLGGSFSEMGLSTSVNKRACNRLRCSDCDFLVSSFDNHQWHSSTDYLFLRNNMPDYERLRSKLTTKRGSRAYACQCKWKAVTELVPLETQMDIKWFCGKH